MGLVYIVLLPVPDNKKDDILEEVWGWNYDLIIYYACNMINIDIAFFIWSHTKGCI